MLVKYTVSEFLSAKGSFSSIDMQRLTKHFDVVQVSDPRVGYELNKSKNATPELFAIYMQNNAIQ